MEAVTKQAVRVSGSMGGYCRCPVCKEVMATVDSNEENGFTYVWYECRDVRCDGQWLEKKPLRGKGA